MKQVVLVTAKGDNESIKDKNVISICDKPALSYVFDAAIKANLINEVFVSTEDQKIKKIAKEKQVHIIDRPLELCKMETNHGDVMLHGINAIKEIIPDLDTVTVLLGNTVMVNSDLIDLAVNLLLLNSEFDSVMSIWLAQDDHPYRALALNNNGFLESYLDIKCDTSRQTYPSIYFYDQGVWTFRHKEIYRRRGPNPWWWMGENCFPIIRRWVTGRDFHSQLDLDIAEWWIETGKKDVFENDIEIQKALNNK